MPNAAPDSLPGIVTGGTDCGIMKYVGQAISEIDEGKGGVQARRARPVIGIATYGVLKAREVLMAGGRHGGIQQAKVATSKGTFNVGLDMNHNVFLLCDDGTREQVPGMTHPYRTHPYRTHPYMTRHT